MSADGDPGPEPDDDGPTPPGRHDEEARREAARTGEADPEEKADVEEVERWPPEQSQTGSGDTGRPNARAGPEGHQARRTPGQAPPAGGGYQRRRMSDHEARNWAVGAHLSSLVGLIGVPSVLGPLVVWLIKRDEHEFVDHQGREALNFQISVLVYTIVGGILAVAFALATFGLGLFVVIPLAIVFGLGVFVLPIVAAVKASDGHAFRYPLTIRFVSGSRRRARQPGPR